MKSIVRIIAMATQPARIQGGTRMRRTEREITDRAFMDQVLEDALEMYVAWNTPASPYVIPLNYVYYKDCLFFHCALEGRKLELLRSDPRVGFTTAVDIAVDGTTTRYRCVCGTGTI